MASVFLDLLPKDIVEADTNNKFRQELGKFIYNKSKKKGTVKGLGNDLPF